MMNVSEYASDVGVTVKEILELCNKLDIKVSKEDDMLSDDDIIILDNELASKYNIGGPAVSASTSSNVEPIPSAVNEQVVSPLPPVSEPIVTNGTPLVAEPSITNNTPIQQVPSFELPKIEQANTNNINQNNVNNNPINFTGNLWEPMGDNLMATTDNFNNMPTNNQNFEVPVSNGQFFGPQRESVPNQIPITGNQQVQTNQNIQGPSMFGQFEQNYNKTA